MKNLILAEINNELVKYTITHTDIENQIQNFSLTFFKARNSQVEWGMKFPMFVPPFYDFIVQSKGKVPSQEEYWNKYPNTKEKRY